MDVMGSVRIRPATASDTQALSDLIIRVLYASNLADYGPANIARVAGHFSVEGVRVMLEDRETIVAEMDGVIVGTAGIGSARKHSGKSIRTFFVDPNVQGQGIGRALFDNLMARVIPGESVTVQSSIAAEMFYAALGFQKLEDVWEGDERTILMQLS